MHAWIKTAIVSALAYSTCHCTEFPRCPGLAKTAQPRVEPWNIQFAKQLAREVRKADAGEGLDLVFYGDSITETWRGTDQGGVCMRCIGVPEVYRSYFGKYKSDVLAVGGDQVAHLHWRLQHGDIPKRPPRLAVILIGINDLGAAADCSHGDDDLITEAAKGVTSRLKQLLELLRSALPQTKLLLLGLWPRGDGKSPETQYQWPGRYTPAIHSINRWSQSAAEKDDVITYLDCSQDFLVDGKINPVVQLDGLHPTASGMEIAARCIGPVVEKLMGQGPLPSLNSSASYLLRLRLRKPPPLL